MHLNHPLPFAVTQRDEEVRFGGRASGGHFVIVIVAQVSKPFNGCLQFSPSFLFLFCACFFFLFYHLAPLTFTVIVLCSLWIFSLSLASLSLSVILSLCLPFSLFFCLFFLTVQSANGIITSPSVLDNHQAPPITPFFHNFCLFPLPLSIF